MAARWPHGGNGDCASARAGYGWRRRGDLLRRSISSARAARPRRQGCSCPAAALSRCCAVKHNMNTKRSSALQVETTAQDVCMRCLLEDETLEAETQRVKSRASRHLVIEHNTISSWRHGIMACVVCQHAQMLHFMLRRAAGLVSLGWADANVMAVHHHNRKRWRRHCHLCGHGFNGGT